MLCPKSQFPQSPKGIWVWIFTLKIEWLLRIFSIFGAKIETQTFGGKFKIGQNTYKKLNFRIENWVFVPVCSIGILCDDQSYWWWLKFCPTVIPWSLKCEGRSEKCGGEMKSRSRNWAGATSLLPFSKTFSLLLLVWQNTRTLIAGFTIF